MQRRLEAVLFDLDGTLIDTAPEFLAISLRLRAEAGLPTIDTTPILQSVSDGAIGMVQTALEIDATDPSFEQWRSRFLAHYEAGLGSLSQPYPGLVALIRQLDLAGVSWGVVTNKLERFAKPLMAKMPFQPAAGVVVTPDHVTHPKPDPEALLLACKVLECDPAKTLFIGDHLRDIQAGSAAGCQTIAAGYGYLAAGELAESWGADITVASSDALAQTITALIA